MTVFDQKVSDPKVDQDTARAVEGAAATDLVRRIQAGEARAETEMVERYGPGLRLLLRRLGAKPPGDDDLYQDTFALVLRKVRDGALREPAALVGFLRSTARNLLLAERRKAGRYDELDDDAAPLDRRGGQLAAEASQLHQVLADEEARMARQLLGELRHDRDREVLMRFYLGDEPSQAICVELGVDPSLFNRVLYRARQRLRELWERSSRQTRLLTGSGSVKKLATRAGLAHSLDR